MAPSAAISEPRFREAASADFIVRYYSDSVSHVLKPLTTEGEFLVACDRPFLLNLAGQQPRRQLAVIVLIHYFNTADESKAKAAWSEDLKRLDYRRVVFLLAGRGKQIDGLPILETPRFQQRLQRSRTGKLTLPACCRQTRPGHFVRGKKASATRVTTASAAATLPSGVDAACNIEPKSKIYAL